MLSDNEGFFGDTACTFELALYVFLKVFRILLILVIGGFNIIKSK